MGRIGIIGGTFDPPHWGHVAIAQAARHQAQLDRILWVPTVQPTYKSQPVSPFWQRLAMVERAIATDPNFQVIEVNRAGTWAADKSHAIAVMQFLQQEFPNQQWFWILGEDAFRSLPRWVDRDRLVACCAWLVAPRSSVPATFGDPFFHQVDWQWLQQDWVPISSTQVRSAVQSGASIQALVCPAVETYIQQFHLYRSRELISRTDR